MLDIGVYFCARSDGAVYLLHTWRHSPYFSAAMYVCMTLLTNLLVLVYIIIVIIVTTVDYLIMGVDYMIYGVICDGDTYIYKLYARREGGVSVYIGSLSPICLPWYGITIPWHSILDTWFWDFDVSATYYYYHYYCYEVEVKLDIKES